jgi:hypothetical protein
MLRQIRQNDWWSTHNPEEQNPLARQANDCKQTGSEVPSRPGGEDAVRRQQLDHHCRAVFRSRQFLALVDLSNILDLLTTGGTLQLAVPALASHPQP